MCARVRLGSRPARILGEIIRGHLRELAMSARRQGHPVYVPILLWDERRNHESSADGDSERTAPQAAHQPQNVVVLPALLSEVVDVADHLERAVLELLHRGHKVGTKGRAVKRAEDEHCHVGSLQRA